MDHLPMLWYQSLGKMAIGPVRGVRKKQRECTIGFKRRGTCPRGEHRESVVVCRCWLRTEIAVATDLDSTIAVKIFRKTADDCL